MAMICKKCGRVIPLSRRAIRKNKNIGNTITCRWCFTVNEIEPGSRMSFRERAIAKGG